MLGSPDAMVCNSKVINSCSVVGLANFFAQPFARTRRQLARVSPQVLPHWRVQDSVRGKLDKNATQDCRQRLRRFMTRTRTRDDTQAPLVGWGPSASSRCGMWTDTLLPPRFGWRHWLEHDQRYTVASESLPADLRTTVPAHDMRWCLLKRETRRTRLEGQWSTTRDCFSSHLDMCSIGWVEKHFLYLGRWGFETDAACGVHADHSRNVCACCRAKCLRGSTHAPRRSNATATVFCCRHGLSAWPFEQGASHGCGGFHTLQRFFNTKIGCQTNNVRKMAGIGRRTNTRATHCVRWQASAAGRTHVCNEVH